MRKDRYALFTDYVQGEVVAVRNIDQFKEVNGSDMPSLLVKIAASHAALKTANKGFYLPERMRDGASTFLLPFKKPVLTHHDDFKDPIGRVQSARYVDLSHLYPVNDAMLQKLAVGGLKDKDLQKTIQYVLKNWTKNDDYQGLGYLELIAEITDPDAIQKILDRRYLTVSTAHSSDAAFCGICMQNWVADGWCEHEPGNIYDDEECVLVPGRHFYSEVSYVNKPADKLASNVAVIDGDKRYQVDDVKPRMVDVRLFCKGPACIYDLASKAQISLQDNEGPLEEVIDSMSDKTKEQKIVDLLTTALADTSKDLPEELVKDGDTLRLAHSLLTVSCCDAEDKYDAKIELSQKLRDKAAGMKIEDLQKNEVEIQVEADAQAGGAGGKKDDLLDLKDILTLEKSYEKMREHLPEEKQLSDANLALLRASDFALPKERAFPCPDCNHIDAVLKVLEQYDAPGIKEAIIDAAKRKKASMKCEEDQDCPKGQQMVNGKCQPMEDAEDLEDKIDLNRINELIDLYAEALPGDDQLLEVTDETPDLLDDKDAAAKRPQDRPGGSNVGKYKTGPFCGPSGGAPKGSYPVNTLKRAKAALAYARHAPNPGGIRACVCRHYPSLPSCGKGKKDADMAEMLNSFNTLRDALIEMGVELECPFCTDNQKEMTKLQAQVEAKDTHIEVQKDQLKVLEDDYRVLSQENVQLTSELTNRLADRAIELRVLGGETIEDVQVAKDEFLTKSIVEMRDSVAKLESAFDFQKAALRLNDGMARNPDGTVKDPTVLVDGQGADSQGQLPSKEQIMKIYNKVHSKSGVKAAREWLSQMKAKYGEHLEFIDNHEEENN